MADFGEARLGGASRDAPPSALDRLFLHGIEAHGRHGVLEFERRLGQPFIVDVDWWIDTGAAVRGDRLADTPCYKDLHGVVVEVIEGQPWNLIETLADRLIAALFDHFPQVARLQVTVHKPEAPIGGKFADVGATCLRERPFRAA